MGMLQFEGAEHDPIFTLENPWFENKKWVSCIPTGEYEVWPYSSQKYPDVYEIKFVENRTHILFHWGNYERDTSGCILLGLSAGMMNGQPSVQKSRKAVEYFLKLTNGEKFILKIGD